MRIQQIIKYEVFSPYRYTSGTYWKFQFWIPKYIFIRPSLSFEYFLSSYFLVIIWLNDIIEWLQRFWEPSISLYGHIITSTVYGQPNSNDLRMGFIYLYKVYRVVFCACDWGDVISLQWLYLPPMSVHWTQVWGDC